MKTVWYTYVTEDTKLVNLKSFYVHAIINASISFQQWKNV